MRILIEQRHGQWTVWCDDRPEVAFVGSTPTEAVFRLNGSEETGAKQQTWRNISLLL